MKVLHVIPAVAPRYGGPSQAVVEMCRALQAQGADVLIATTDADGTGHLPVVHARPVSYFEVPTIFFPRQWSEAFKYSRALARWLEQHVNEFEVVHIHAVFSHACLAAARICRRHNVPYIVRPLGTLDPWSLKQKRLRKQLYWRMGGRRMLRNATAVHYTTTEERRLVEESLGLSRGVVVRLGVAEDLLLHANGTQQTKARNPLLADSDYILVLSRLHTKKGLDLLMQAFVRVIREREFRRWKLVLAGEGDAHYVERLRRMAMAGGAGDQVVFTGWLEGEAKYSILKDAALLALPSYQENFGICVVEALAYGVPVLISPNVNLAKDIEDVGAGWVANLEHESLTSTLGDALKQKSERTRRGQAGREYVNKHFAWSAVAAELLTLYRATIAKSIEQPNRG
jgi:glycosyltransferase involved in cell wall biosynthesis